MPPKQRSLIVVPTRLLILCHCYVIARVLGTSTLAVTYYHVPSTRACIQGWTRIICFYSSSTYSHWRALDTIFAHVLYTIVSIRVNITSRITQSHDRPHPFDSSSSCAYICGLTDDRSSRLLEFLLTFLYPLRPRATEPRRWREPTDALALTRHRA